MKYNILFADDDESIRFVIAKFLSRKGYKVQATDNPQTLMKWIAAGDGDLVLSDVHMGVADIFNFIPEIKKLRPQLPLIVISANTSVMTALKSANYQVFDYVPKPFDLAHLEHTIKRALGNNPPRTVDKKPDIGPIIGKSACMQPVFRAISDYMSADIAVNIHGRAGTGKTLVAQLLHDAGKRKNRPFVYFDEQNPDLARSEVKNGDLFVGHIGNLSAEGQQSLLKLLIQNGRQPDTDKFRLLSTSCYDQADNDGMDNIRADLTHHVLGGRIYVPPLVDRLDDMDALAAHFLPGSQGRTKKRKLSNPALVVLKTHIWPGNIRELKHSMEILALRYPDLLIGREIVAEVLREQSPRRASASSDRLANMAEACRKLLMARQTTAPTPDGPTPYQEAVAWIEKPLIEEALKITGGNNLQAAALLGIHRNTLRVKIEVLKVDI